MGSFIKMFPTFMVLLTVALHISASLPHKKEDIKVTSGVSYRSSGGYNCDDDCRRSKRRRIIKETKTEMSNIRNGRLTEREQNIHVMPDRLLAGMYVTHFE